MHLSCIVMVCELCRARLRSRRGFSIMGRRGRETVDLRALDAFDDIL